MTIVDIVMPTYLVIPSKTPATEWANATSGALCMSGANFCFHNGTKWATVTTV